MECFPERRDNLPGYPDLKRLFLREKNVKTRRFRRITFYYGPWTMLRIMFDCHMVPIIKGRHGFPGGFGPVME